MFSANGVGEEQIGGGVRSIGLGGGGFGLADTMSFNSTNPALMAFAPRTQMRIGGHAAFWNTTENGVTDSDGEMTWKDLALYLPVMRQWRLGLGVQPTRRQDIHLIAIRSAVFPAEDPGDPPFTKAYEERITWAGSTVDFRLDNAYRFSDRLAVGIGAIYTVQHNERTSLLDFQDTDFRDVRLNEVSTFRGWSFSLGAYVSPVERVGIGGYFRPRLQGSWTQEFGKSGTDSTLKRDDLVDAPGEAALGISYELTPSFRGVADIRMGQWKAGDYGLSLSDPNTPSPDNPIFFSVGVEREGRRAPLYSGFDLWGYRAGVFYRQHYWNSASGTSVEDIGLALGFSIPVAHSSGWLHAAAELGQRGFDEDNLGAQERFARFSFQVEIGETWFQRAKPRLPE